MELAPLLVFFRYDDVPGVIGRVGTLFGEAGVNIANMAVSRIPPRRKGADGALRRLASRRRSWSTGSARRASTTPASSRSDKAWVAAQFALMALIAASWFVGPPVSRLGLVPALAGVGLVVWAGRTMGGSLTPFPTPPPHGRLVQNGPFRWVRHPIYVGGTLVLGGLSLAFSGWGLLLTGVLAIFWIAKARHEERLLLERFPEYAEYRRRTWF